MDWLKLFALLIAVASVKTRADVPKKKILIHLPEKVKHIHHHKKIYITNHPATSHYAPAFMPSAEGAVAVPTNVAVPASESVELYDGRPTRMPGISSASSKLLPLYRARGYYGPTPNEWDEQDYDSGSPAEPINESYLAAAYTIPSTAPTAPSKYPPKRVKVIKLKEASRKPVTRKNKPKRVPIRPKPQHEIEDELPVTMFHEQFYSDLEGAIKTVKKPKRVEKIVDGDTEHIHTYSEEHIHKLVFNDGSKHPRGTLVDANEGLAALASSHPLVPLKNLQTVIAIPSDTLTKFATIGSMGTPSQLEYAAYNPRDVTHDHIFHDHGEIPPGIDLSKNPLLFPPKATYSSQGLRLGGSAKQSKGKYGQKYLKPYQKPTQLTDLPYFDQLYAPFNKLRNIQKPQIFSSFDPSAEEETEDYRPFKTKSKGTPKPRNILPALYFSQGKQLADYRQQQSNTSPYSVSSTVVHEYKPKHYSDHSFAKINKDIISYPKNNYEYDTYAASSNVYTAENYQKKKSIKTGKKKSVSRQNLSIGGLDSRSTVEHFDDIGASGIPSAFDDNHDQTKSQQSAPTTFVLRESSPVHSYYSNMAMKAFNDGDQLSVAQASNNNYQYAVVPLPSPTSNDLVAVSTVAPSPGYYDVTSSAPITTEPTNYKTRPKETKNEKISDSVHVHKEPKKRYTIITHHPKGSLVSHESDHSLYKADTVAGKLKYGDKI